MDSINKKKSGDSGLCTWWKNGAANKQKQKRTDGSSRPNIAPSFPVLTLLLFSSPSPAPGSASAQSCPPPLPQTEGVGLCPVRGRMADFLQSAQAGDRNHEKGTKKCQITQSIFTNSQSSHYKPDKTQASEMNNNPNEKEKVWLWHNQHKSWVSANYPKFMHHWFLLHLQHPAENLLTKVSTKHVRSSCLLPVKKTAGGILRGSVN